MKKTAIPVLALALTAFLAAGCAAKEPTSGATDAPVESPAASYVSITQAEAKEVMDSGEDIVILDVRSQEEYDSGHIENAVLIPHTEITQRAPEELLDKDQTILVYCRSGNRSKTASQALADLGYTDVREFGGISTWEYGTVK